MISWSQGLIESLRETPFGFFTAAIGLSALVLGGAMGLVALRRRRAVLTLQRALRGAAAEPKPVRFSPWVEIAILAPTMIVALMTLAAMELARARMLAALEPEATAKVMFAMAAGIAGQLNAVALGSILLLLLLPLAGAGIGFALTYRHQGRVHSQLLRARGDPR